MCENHKRRKALAMKCKLNRLCDTFGTFDGGSLIKISQCLQDYMYSIVIENDISAYYFTGKLTSCFALMTIPIYYGATEIEKFFNIDGIIRINSNDLDNIELILKKCTKEFYLSRLPAIIDNYNRVTSYNNTWDWLYKTYFQEVTVCN